MDSSPLLMLQEIDKNKRVSIYDYYLRTLYFYKSQDGYVGLDDLPINSKRRLTHQFISAMIACGLGNDSPMILNAFDWLIESRDSGDDEIKNVLVLDKIEAAIEMGKHGEKFYLKAFDYLDKVRRPDNITFDIPGEEPRQFTSLWIAKIFMLHPDREKYKPIIDRILTQFSNSTVLRAREKSLLYSLCSQFWPDTYVNSDVGKNLEMSLDELLFEGLFDFPTRIQENIKYLTNFGLSPNITSGIEKDLFNSIISTSYFIMNMQLVPNKSEQIRKMIEKCTNSLINILSKDVKMLTAVFPDPYQQIMIAARIIIGLEKVTSDNIPNLVFPETIAALVEMDKKNLNQKSEFEKNHIRDVIRRWINIDWKDQDLTVLGGGLSNAKVIRVQPSISIPTEGEDTGGQIFHRKSLIIKFGRKIELDLERKNFQKIPPEYSSNYASIPTNVLFEIVDDEPTEYLIIQDLFGYITLQEAFQERSEKKLKNVLSRLIEFFQCLYTMPTIPTDMTGFILQKYVSPMTRSLEKINILRKQLRRFEEKDNVLLSKLQKFQRTCFKYDLFTPTIAHGDLNIRNVMLKGVSDDKKTIEFKLIDLDKFTRCGDIAYDIGEFISDLENVIERGKLQSRITPYCNEIKQSFFDYAMERKDLTYPLRFYLSSSRSYLKLCEIETREFLSRSILDPLGERKANQVIDEITPHLYQVNNLIDQVLSFKIIKK